MKDHKSFTMNNLENKNAFIFCCLFLFLVIFLASLVVFYISSNIILVDLGYKIIELEQCKAELEEQNKKCELQADTLAALDRIEAIACSKLGMIRPSRVEFVAMNSRVNINKIENIGAKKTPQGKEDYFWASVDVERKNNLILGVLK